MSEERKLVSVLFADIVGSTALGHDNDPEVVRTVMARYFERAQEIVELHGGTVEKFIGDAVMAVFGVPRVHDDDAERAVRAALALRDAVLELNSEVAIGLEARVGVNSGEAVAAVDQRDQQLVTGDVVNVAARLQQSAEPGEVVVGELTMRLTRTAIEYEPLPPLDARGKPMPVQAHRATRPFSETPEQARGLPQMRARLVGRDRELGLLIDTFERAVSDERLHLFTIVGNAGVGKSRLVGEFLARVGSRAGVLRGRCLPYGTGITYWPLRELIQSDLGVTLQHGRAEVSRRLEQRTSEMAGELDARAAIVRRLAVLLGLSDAADALPDVEADRLPDELAWAVAQYMRGASAAHPLVTVIDDLQWAERALVDVIAGLLEALADSPIVLICIGRPELLERYPSLGAGHANAATIVLEPLSDEQTRTLIARLLDIDDMPDELRAAIVQRAAGNPLFCEEFVRMLIDEGRLVREGGRWRAADSASFEVRVPESIQALLAARIDTLPAASKLVLQIASVIGEAFAGRQLGALAGRPTTDPLRALIRAGFVTPDRSTGPDAYRFRHLLIRDAAYSSLPKTERARLHEAFAQALEEEAGDRHAEFVEILAHHAHQSLTLSLELRQAGPAVVKRAERSLRLSSGAARRAVERGDPRALASFLSDARAARQAIGDLPTGDNAELALLEAQSEALAGNYPVARQRLQAAIVLAESAGRKDLAAAAHLALAEVLVFAAGEDELPNILQALERASSLYQELGDAAGHIRAQVLGLEPLFAGGRLSEMIERGLQLIDDAVAAGVPAVAAQTTGRLISAAIWTGRMALAEQLADRAEAMAAELGLLRTRRLARFFRTRLTWARGDFAAAEASLRALLADAEAVGDGQAVIMCSRLLAETMLEQGRLAEAEANLDLALARSIDTGERWHRTELLAWKATVRASDGDFDGAEQALAESASTLRADDIAAIAVYNLALGQIRALQGRDVEAEEAMRRAVSMIRRTEYWWWQNLALDLAEFLISRGRVAEAAPLVEEVEEAIAGTEIGVRRDQLHRLKRQLAVQPA